MPYLQMPGHNPGLTNSLAHFSPKAAGRGSYDILCFDTHAGECKKALGVRGWCKKQEKDTHSLMLPMGAPKNV